MPQNAPPQEASKEASKITFAILLALGGAAAASIGVFLPWVEAATDVPIVHNSLIQSGEGWIVIALSIAALGAAWRGRESAERNMVVAALGVCIIAFAIYVGTGDRLELVFANGDTVQGSPGIGIYVVGAGGLALIVAGLRADG